MEKGEQKGASSHTEGYIKLKFKAKLQFQLPGRHQGVAESHAVGLAEGNVIALKCKVSSREQFVQSEILHLPALKRGLCHYPECCNSFSSNIWSTKAITVPGLDCEEKLSYLLHSLLLAAAQEGPKQTAIQVIQDGYQEVLIELKCCRKLQTDQKVRLGF